ncbi:uncharacterized protein LOC121972244 [Zingiber officinale]|uniref:Senescence regulator n=1 Tax=Zingiber officinale TaxID=94328 RepID=A0A8J5GTA1_ZINOF|nr:uncharacterized protein LOC121972244 [Zingiber officinale]KAG6513580.1 hypothetical protein ZIOFF_023912 [Zingiber officinale]
MDSSSRKAAAAMATARRHTADRLLGSVHGRAAGTDLPDLAEDEVFWPAGDSSWWRQPDPDRFRREGEVDRCGPHRRPAAASSAPVVVPAWPSFLSDGTARWEEAEKEVDEEDERWMPPHEYLARAKGRSSSTSVFEGTGRMLKGRDVIRVRDAIWSRTGFYG